MNESVSAQMRSEAVLHAQDYMQILRSRWKVVLLVFLLVFVSSAVITKMMTPQYSSGMSFEIKMPRDIINVAVGGEGNPIAAMADNNAYMQTQFEILVSQQNLIAVANKLDLPNEWGVDEAGAAARLSRVIEVMPRKNTNLVDIMVEMDDPRVAQQVCQAVVDCYKEIREEKETGLLTRLLISVMRCFVLVRMSWSARLMWCASTSVPENMSRVCGMDRLAIALRYRQGLRNRRCSS